MKKLLLLALLAVSALASRAQTTVALADSSFAHHNYVTAYQYYTQALQAAPHNVTYLRRAGFCLMNCEGQELNATRFFADALKIQPNDPVSHYYLGVIFMDKAKAESDASQKAHFKALAQSHLETASNYGSEQAKAAISRLNGI